MSTQQLAGRLFSYRDLGNQALRGFDEPVRAWQVLGASDVESRFEALRSEATPLMGRDGDIELFCRHWTQAKVGSGRTVSYRASLASASHALPLPCEVGWWASLHSVLLLLFPRLASPAGLEPATLNLEESEMRSWMQPDAFRSK
jgi:hypothetical protein